MSFTKPMSSVGWGVVQKFFMVFSKVGPADIFTRPCVAGTVLQLDRITDCPRGNSASLLIHLFSKTYFTLAPLLNQICD